MVLGPANQRVAYERLSHGRYSFKLPAGTYKLVEQNSGNRDWKRANAQPGKTTVVNFVIEAS